MAVASLWLVRRCFTLMRLCWVVLAEQQPWVEPLLFLQVVSIFQTSKPQRGLIDQASQKTDVSMIQTLNWRDLELTSTWS